jgi:protein-disulfide isomerase
MSKSYKLLPKSTALVVLAFFTIAMGGQPEANAAKKDEQESLSHTVSIERSLGNPEAKVTVIEYASLTCGHCAFFHSTIYPEMKRDFIDTNKIYYIFRDYPLDRMALNVATALRCLPEEQYFGMLSLILEQQTEWVHPEGHLHVVKDLFKQAGITEAEFDACVANKEIQAAIMESQVAGSKQFNIRGTPTIVVNNTVIPVANYANLKVAIESALEK